MPYFQKERDRNEYDLLKIRQEKQEWEKDQEEFKRSLDNMEAMDQRIHELTKTVSIYEEIINERNDEIRAFKQDKGQSFWFKP